MRVRRKTAARILSEAASEGRKLTATEVAYLANPDKQTPAKTLAETGAAYLAARVEVGLSYKATGKELAEARKAKGIVKVSGKGKSAPTFTAGDIPERSSFASQGQFLAACKAFSQKYGVKVGEARKQVPAMAASTLTSLSPEQVEALQAAGLLDPQ